MSKDLGASELLGLAADSGRLSLEMGGETYRAEDTMVDMASALGAEDAEAFAIPTGTFLSFEDAQGQTHSIVRRVKRRAMDLGGLAELHRLRLGIKGGRINLDQAREGLRALSQRRDQRQWLSAMAGSLVAPASTLLYGGGWADALVSAPIGAAISMVLVPLARKAALADAIRDALGGALAALCTGVAAVFIPGLDMESIIVGSLMLLVPGAALVNAIRDVMSGDLVAGMGRGAEAFMSAAALSLGTALSLSLLGFLGLWGRS